MGRKLSIDFFTLRPFSQALPLRWLHPAGREEGRSVDAVYGLDCECNRVFRFAHSMGGNTKGSPRQRRAPFVTALITSKRVDRGLRPGSLGKKYHKKIPPVKSPEGIFLTTYLATDHEHPEVLPQPSQTKQEPAIRILVPQVMQSGASDD